MNCRQARDAINEADQGLPESGRRPALATHLVGCAACNREAALASRLADELARLRREVPFAIEVSPRVMARVRTLAASPREEIPSRQLGLAAAFGSATALLLVAWFFDLLPQIGRFLHGTWVTISVLVDPLLRLARPIGTLLAVPFKLLWRLIQWALPLLDGIGALAIGGVAFCTLAMAATIALVLARDLRHAHPLMIREDS